MIVREGATAAGSQVVHRFDNGYGASVVRGPFTYGGPDLFELAVLTFDNKGGWRLTYETPITDDVIGYLAEGDVDALLRQIEALPSTEQSGDLEARP